MKFTTQTNYPKRKIKQEYNVLEYILFLFSLNISVVSLIRVKYLRNIYSCNSVIDLVIRGNGTQNILYPYFNSYPSEVLVNGIKNYSCNKTCYLEKELNNITLRFKNEMGYCANMFRELNNIIEINLTNFNNKITNMFAMFHLCRNLEKITFGNINTSSVTNMQSLFNGCYRLKSIDLRNFDTSNVINMNYLFQSCSILTSINISNFDTSKVITMYHMFAQCSKLENIFFGNINTSSVKNMQALFLGCSSLSSLNLSYFDTSKVTTFQWMFNGCSKLTYLNLSHFKTSHISNIYGMFQNCGSLLYLNLYSFKLNTTVNKTRTFNGISPLTKFCINDIDTENFLLG